MGIQNRAAPLQKGITSNDTISVLLCWKTDIFTIKKPLHNAELV